MCLAPLAPRALRVGCAGACDEGSACKTRHIYITSERQRLLAGFGRQTRQAATCIRETASACITAASLEELVSHRASRRASPSAREGQLHHSLCEGPLPHSFEGCITPLPCEKRALPPCRRPAGPRVPPPRHSSTARGTGPGTRAGWSGASSAPAAASSASSGTGPSTRPSPLALYPLVPRPTSRRRPRRL